MNAPRFPQDIYERAKQALDAAEADIAASPKMDRAAQRKIRLQRIAQAISEERIRCLEVAEIQHEIEVMEEDFSTQVAIRLIMKHIAGGKVWQFLRLSGNVPWGAHMLAPHNEWIRTLLRR